MDYYSIFTSQIYHYKYEGHVQVCSIHIDNGKYVTSVGGCEKQTCTGTGTFKANKLQVQMESRNRLKKKTNVYV